MRGEVMARTALVTAITLCIFMTSGVPGLRSQEAKLEGLDAFIERALKEYGVPGASVAVVKNGKAVYLKGHGFRKTGTREKVDENTIFQLASVTKIFTAASVASMVDRGKVGFDEEVVKIIPNFALKDPYPTRYATPRDLLAHRAGLPAFTGDLFDHLGYTREEVIKRVRYIEPACSFREKANYSNVGYFLAGEAAAYAAGAAWEDVVTENLLKPLGMTRTGFTGTLARQSNVASPHAVVDGETRTIPNNQQLVLAPAGAMTSTASDLSRYMIMLLDGGKYDGREVLKKDSINEMFTPSMVGKPGFAELPPISEDTGFNYGLAWGIYYWKNHKILEKGGALDGMRSVIVLVPETGLGIAVLANMNLTVLPEAVRAYVLEQYLGKAGYHMQAEIKRRSKKIEAMIGPAAIVKPENPKPASKELSAYTGTYENELYGKLEVVKDGDKLTVEAGPAKYRGILTHVNYDTFYLKWPIFISIPDEVTFVINAKGDVTGFIDDELGRFRKVEQPAR
jgi:CubicO group peptidase (beta-lactamase class C family)